MTSVKRKSSLPRTTAKRQKLKECESHSVAPKKKSTSIKTKTNPRATEKDKTPKKPTNKAIKNSKTSKAEAGRNKSTVVKATKSTPKRVSTTGKNLRSAKDVISTKKSTQKSSTSASKAQKPSQSNVSKTEVKGSNKSNKSIKSASKSSPLKQAKNIKCVKKNISTKTRHRPDLKPVTVKKTVKNAHCVAPSKTLQAKAKKCDLQATGNKQAKKVISVKKRTSSLKKQATIGKETVKKSKLKPNTKAPKSVVQKVTETPRPRIKPSLTESQQSVTSVLSKKKSEDKTKQRNAKNTGKKLKVEPKDKIKKSEAKSKTCSKPVKRCSLINQSKSSDSAINNNVEPEITVSNISLSCNNSNQILNSSTKSLPGEGAASLKRKRGNIKAVDGTTKSIAKKRKVIQSQANEKKDAPSEEVLKCKKVSILDLCNEIAGEIESDTVEVVKEPSSPIIEENTEKETAQILVDTSPPSVESSPVNPLKRFFPSRKPLQIKLEKKTSPGTKNSKWNKIKLKNNFSQNNMLRKRALLPSLEAIKAKVPHGQQPAPAVPVSSNSKKSDTTSATQNRQAKPIKDNTNKIPGAGNVKEKTTTENGLLENHIKQDLEAALDEGFRLHLDSSPENTPVKRTAVLSSLPEIKPSIVSNSSNGKPLTEQMAASAERGVPGKQEIKSTKAASDVSIQKEIRKLKEANHGSSKQPIIDAGQKRFGAISCCVCGMLYTASNPEDETQHLLFHNQFISAVKYVGWKKERILAEYPDGKVIMVLPDDPKYALRKVEEIREMVDNDLGFQQVPLRIHSRTKTLMFVSSDKKVVGCLIAEHIQWGYRVIDDYQPNDLSSDTEKLFSERVKAWCCSTTAEPAVCGVSRIWVFSMMRRKKIASRLLECLR